MGRGDTCIPNTSNAECRVGFWEYSPPGRGVAFPSPVSGAGGTEDSPGSEACTRPEPWIEPWPEKERKMEASSTSLAFKSESFT